MSYQSETDKPKTSAAGAKILSVIIFALAAGGLFLGLLGQVWETFSSEMLIQHLTVDTLSGSLMGNIIAIFQDLIENGLDAFTNAIDIGGMSAAQYFLHFVLILAVAFTVLLTIVSLCSSKAARRCAYLAAYVNFIAYGALSACYFYQTTLEYSGRVPFGETFFILDLFDLPTLVISAVIAIILSVMAISKKKGMGFLHVLLLFFSAAAALAIFYPIANWSLNTGYIFHAAVTGGEGLDIWTKIFAGIVGFATVLNLLLSALRISSRKGVWFDFARYLIQLLAVIALTFIYLFDPIVEDLTVGDIAPEMFTTIPYIVLLTASIVVLIVTIMLTMSASSKKEQEAETHNRVTPENVYMEPVASGAPRPIIVQAPAQPEAPMSEFEKSMEALARGAAPAPGATAPAAAPAQVVYRTEYKPKADSHPAPAPVKDNAPSSSNTYESAQFTYDPFINSLTPLQKNEFGDLFIAGKYGKLEYLPPYVIGGDNSEFFRKVFIYLGKYRNYVSADLLDKLCAYVAKS